MWRCTENSYSPESAWMKSLWSRGLRWVQQYETALFKQQHPNQEGCCLHGSEVWRKLCHACSDGLALPHSSSI